MAELFTFNESSSPALSKSKVQEISGVIIYYVYTGRNSWHSIWSTKYSSGCMHTTLESAKKYCEKRRTQGTVFNIKQLPSLSLKTNNGCVVVTQINTNSPLTGYSMNAVQERDHTSGLNNYIWKGVNVMDVVNTFLPDSRFWLVSPPYYNSIITVFSYIKNELFTSLNQSTSLIEKTSYSQGKGYALGWNDNIINVDSDSIIKISNEFT